MDEKVVLQIVALISCTASVLVVLTLVLFREMRQKIFMRIIAYISVADFLGNFSYVFLNRPDNHSLSCQFQGFCNTYFYPVSWVWTTILVYFLYSLACTGKLPLSESTSHLLGWGLPLVLATIVLTTNSYSRFIDDDSTEVCTLGPDNLSAFIWRLVLYYFFFALCVLIMLVWYYRIGVLQRRGTSAVSARTINFARNSLQLYPLAMSICWLPELVGFFLQFTEANDDYYDFTMNLRICNGTLTAIIFFWKSPTAREYWYNMLTRGASTPPATVSRSHHVSSNSEADVEEFFHFDLGRKSLLDAAMIGFEDQPRPTEDVKMSTVSIGIYS